MADKLSPLYERRTRLVDNRDAGGRQFFLRMAWTVTAPEQNGDRIFLVELPRDCQVLDAAIAWDALGTSVTMSLGDLDSATRYVNAQAVNAAGHVRFPTTRAAMNFRPANLNQRTVILTWGGANPTVGATVEGFFRVVLTG